MSSLISRLFRALIALAVFVAINGAGAAQVIPNAPASTGAAAKGPLLFFSASDVPALKEKIQSPEYAAIWKQVADKAQAYCDPKSHDYADPAVYRRDSYTGDFASLHASRQLSNWMETIGFVYQMTGNASYGEHGAAVLEAAVRSLPVTSKVMAGRVGTPYGDMMRAIAVGLDLLSDAMTPEQRKVIVETGRGYMLRHVADYNVPNSPWTTYSQSHNYNGVCGGAVGLLGIALRNDYPDEAPAWIKLGQKMSHDWLRGGFDRQGSYFEGVQYMCYGLGNVAIFADALKRYDGERDLIETLQSKGITRFLAMQKLPGEAAFDARNDSLYSVDLSGGSGICSPFVLAMASGFGGVVAPDPLAAWLWRNGGPTRGNEPLQIAWGNRTPPQDPSTVLADPGSAYYADQGLCIWRTGWNKSDTMFSIEAGPYHPVTHNQADKGHFNLYALGYRWAADTGYGNNREPNGRCQTVCHSCVLIDGKGQALTGAALGTDGKVLRYDNNARQGYALVDALSAYNHNNGGGKGVPLDKALRHVLFIRPSMTTPSIPAYAVVLDDMDWSGQPHQFTWQMITWQDMKIETDGITSFTIRPSARATDPKMRVLLNASAPMSLTSEVFTPDDYPGRAPNTYQRIRATATTSNPHFVAVLAPLPAGSPEPRLSVTLVSGGRTVAIDWGVRTDTISWTGDDVKLRD
ncbi:MAG: heparinase II/III family protein [Capsulimonadaceae bacterium]|nr:heparinase II/III family protein [Capsulimonadaceae bacterium]